MEKRFAIIAAYFLTEAFGYFIEYLNIRRLRMSSNIVLREFEGMIDGNVLKKSQEYTLGNARFSIASSLFNNLVILAFFFGGLLNIYGSLLKSLRLPFVLSGLLFFLILYYVDTALMIPFSLYRTFRVEKSHGFNTMTPGLWMKDFLKSLATSSVLISIIVLAGLFIVEESPHAWWLWVWLLFLALSVFMMYVSPFVIAPLFNKFDPIDDEALVEAIKGLAEKAGIKVKSVFRMDASKRTMHTNAYFTGIGKVKRIVLYDTLLERLDTDEIKSVLAHEIGHWKRKHVLKLMAVTEIIALAVFFISFKLLQGDALNDLFNVHGGTFFTKVIILGFLGSIAALPAGPLMLYLSRRHEIEADAYACKLTGNAGALADSLVKLSRDNLSNINPHPLYVVFHYSHPPVIERVRRINESSGRN